MNFDENAAALQRDIPNLHTGKSEVDDFTYNELLKLDGILNFRINYCEDELKKGPFSTNPYWRNEVIVTKDLRKKVYLLLETAMLREPLLLKERTEDELQEIERASEERRKE